MPEIIEIYQYSPINNTTSWESEILNIVSARYITFTVFCSENYDITVEWSISEDFVNIIDTDNKSVTGGESGSLQIPVKAKYIRFRVDNIASTPNILCTQGFFWE